jgi:DNA polymerase
MKKWKLRRPDQRTCNYCRLYKTRTNVVVSDGGIRQCNIVAIGEGPGAEEDKTGKPFKGQSGQLLRKYAKKYANLILGKEVVVLNIVSCRPPQNRDPYRDEIKECRNWLRLNLAIIRPKLILLVGRVAATNFLANRFINGRVYKNEDLRDEWTEKAYRFSCMPIWHPAYLLRNRGNIEIYASWANNLRKFGRVARRLNTV